jgi:hypothetical protein
MSAAAGGEGVELFAKFIPKLIITFFRRAYLRLGEELTICIIFGAERQK